VVVVKVNVVYCIFISFQAFLVVFFIKIDMDAITEAIMINTIIERKILIRSESIAILKLLNILRLIFSNFL
jgi:hypothetical protein